MGNGHHAQYGPLAITLQVCGCRIQLRRPCEILYLQAGHTSTSHCGGTLHSYRRRTSLRFVSVALKKSRAAASHLDIVWLHASGRKFGGGDRSVPLQDDVSIGRWRWTICRRGPPSTAAGKRSAGD